MSQRTDVKALHFAVFVFPDFGHVNPVLQTARELMARGDRVTFVIDRRFAPLVEGTGARAVVYDSERGDFYRAAVPSPDQLAADGYALLMETMDKVYPLAMAAFQEDPPDVVLYDFESVIAARMTAYRLGAVSVQFFPSHAANDSFSLRAQMWDAENPVMVKGAHAVVDFVRTNGVADADLGRFANEWDDRNLVFLPKLFQMQGDIFDDSYAFTGPTVTEYAGPAWTPARDSERLALVSLGTESVARPGFLQDCADAFDSERWHVVMTTGRGVDPARLGPVPEHVEIHAWLPHPAVLPRADVLVCHGGMGSVMEALYYATPVVTLPQAHELAISARRLEELRVGRTVLPDRFTPDTLADAVDALTTDPDLAGRLAEVRTAVREAGGAAGAADRLRAWAPQPRG
ncbi:macrolide family glycosyltransferase [Streptantibioticus silvisoli]|uniref:Glycosyltransferase n=1 Tax=Streptantibioticus silvisoli TaxID=2705255 RepID=A0ABT6VZ37_9ACTN|nr:macrolide family glycosyltransferase [Streptantibioticus silvisoli]MDI5963743.1 glycosyltransferase [Streptantibioticus silvisoli]